MELNLNGDGDEEPGESGIDSPSVDGRAQSADTDTEETTEPPEPDGESDEGGRKGKLSPDLSEAVDAARDAVSGEEDSESSEESGSDLLVVGIAVIVGAFLMLRDDADDALDDIFQGGNNGPPGV